MLFLPPPFFQTETTLRANVSGDELLEGQFFRGRIVGGPSFLKPFLSFPFFPSGSEGNCWSQLTSDIYSRVREVDNHVNLDNRDDCAIIS